MSDLLDVGHDVLVQEWEDLCNLHPDWFGIDVADDLPEFLPVGIIETTTAYNDDGSCAEYDDTTTVAWESDTGLYCEGTYHVECGDDGKGGCGCEWSQHGEIVCTDQ